MLWKFPKSPVPKNDSNLPTLVESDRENIIRDIAEKIGKFLSASETKNVTIIMGDININIDSKED